MFAIVDTFNKAHGEFGTVVSRHHKMETAAKAQDQIQASVRRRNGQNSYLPTVLVRLIGARIGRVGRSIPCDWSSQNGRWEQLDRPCREVAILVDRNDY
jgi:hypothetical protein